MNKVVTFALGLMLGFVAAQKLYSAAFDPESYWGQAKHLAYQAYYLGCIQGELSDAECRLRANKFYSELL